MVKHWKGSSSVATIGLELVLCIVVGLLGGRWLDGRFGTAPWLGVIGFGFGVAAGAKAIWRGYKEMQAVTAREEREQGNPTPVYGEDEKPDDEPPAQEQNESGDAPKDGPNGN